MVFEGLQSEVQSLRLSGREFQDVGPAYANAHPSYVARLTFEKFSSPRRAQRRWWPGTLDTGWQSVDRYPGARLCKHLYTWTVDTNSEPNLVISMQPVKLASPELTHSLIVLACIGDDSGRSTENTLQLVGCLLWRTDQQTATIVDPAGDKRLDESSGRFVVETASDAAQLSKLKEAFGAESPLTAVTCLSRDKPGVSRTPRTWTASDWTTWASPSVKEWQQAGIFDTLCLVSVHISPVLSMLRLSQLAATPLQHRADNVSDFRGNVVHDHATASK